MLFHLVCQWDNSANTCFLDWASDLKSNKLQMRSHLQNSSIHPTWYFLPLSVTHGIVLLIDQYTFPHSTATKQNTAQWVAITGCQSSTNAYSQQHPLKKEWKQHKYHPSECQSSNVLKLKYLFGFSFSHVSLRKVPTLPQSGMKHISTTLVSGGLVSHNCA